MKNEIKIAPLIYDLVVTIIAVSGVYYGSEFNVVATLVLICGTIKNCYKTINEAKDTPRVIIIINCIILILAAFMLFLTIGVYNGNMEPLVALKKLSLSCTVKIGLDIVYAICYNIIAE